MTVRIEGGENNEKTMDKIKDGEYGIVTYDDSDPAYVGTPVFGFDEGIVYLIDGVSINRASAFEYRYRPLKPGERIVIEA